MAKAVVSCHVVQMGDVIIENEQLRLIVGANAIAKSLTHKPSGEECLAAGEETALFSVTQERPFNNEAKLMHPNKRTAFQANAIRRDGCRLIAGFEIAPYEAVVEVNITPWYIGFSLVDFLVDPPDYEGLAMTPPPVSEMRFLQLPVRNRDNFGEWLNVSWDNKVAVNVLGTTPCARIDSERRKGCRVMSANAEKDIRLKGVSAALIVSTTDRLLDNIAKAEENYNLPRGVESRRGDMINASMYWSGSVTPNNVDEHIKYAGIGGFRCMLLYYTCVFKESGYAFSGNYEYREEYPNGRSDLEAMLNKIKEAGITPGFHFLHSFIGLKSRYVAPVADHRLNLAALFSLSRPLGESDTVAYIEQNPEGAAMADGCRVLKIGGELATYTGYTIERPYSFTGVERGAFGTGARSHPLGLIFGILDISEFGAQSVYIDQNTSLQDEVAEKIADAFNSGFRFAYFDGSEGVNAPFGFHVPNAQYRVYKLMRPEPLFAEGAAKAHFSWHMLSGGNAFDIFPPEAFKDKIRQFPAEEAPRMRQDFTRLNFGWWGYWAPGTQPDMLEFAISRAAAWDCPITLQANIELFKAHPRTPDNLEVIRRWEDARAKKWLTEGQKLMLRDLGQEHILLINESMEYELVPYDEIAGAARGNKEVRAFAFERNGERYIVYWHTSGSKSIELPLDRKDVTLLKALGEDAAFVSSGCAVTVPVGERRYIKSGLPKECLAEAFRNAKLV